MDVENVKIYLMVSVYFVNVILTAKPLAVGNY